MIYIKSGSLRKAVADILTNMKTDPNDIDDVLVQFETKLSKVEKRLNELESRISRLESLLEKINSRGEDYA